MPNPDDGRTISTEFAQIIDGRPEENFNAVEWRIFSRRCGHFINDNADLILSALRTKEALAARPGAEVKGDAAFAGWASAISEIDPDEGRWKTCSGCYESEDGHPVGKYPFSRVLGCVLGGGCHECGGLGACWDTTNYREIGDELSTPPPAADMEGFVKVETIIAAALDPVRVMFFDDSPGVGRIIIECYGDAWAAYWGAMGNRTVREFVQKSPTDYIVTKIARSEDLDNRGIYMTRIVKAIQAHLAASPAPSGMKGEGNG